MRKRLSSIAPPLTLALAVAGCAGNSASDRFVRDPAPPPAGPVIGPAAGPATGRTPSPAFVAPRVQSGSGLDSVIGADARTLSRRFGETRIDLVEGDARKLQYAASSCVLDIYLYPLQAGGTPVATHVEARARQGGAAFDRAACIADLAERSSR